MHSLCKCFTCRQYYECITCSMLSHFTSDDDAGKQSVFLQCHEKNAEQMSETPLNVPSRFWVLLWHSAESCIAPRSRIFRGCQIPKIPCSTGLYWHNKGKLLFFLLYLSSGWLYQWIRCEQVEKHAMTIYKVLFGKEVMEIVNHLSWFVGCTSIKPINCTLSYTNSCSYMLCQQSSVLVSKILEFILCSLALLTVIFPSLFLDKALFLKWLTITTTKKAW